MGAIFRERFYLVSNFVFGFSAAEVLRRWLPTPRRDAQAMRKVTGSLSKSQCTVVFLNQLRSKIGVIYGSPEVTSGEWQYFS